MRMRRYTFAIDPGNTVSGFVFLRAARIVECSIVENDVLLRLLRELRDSKKTHERTSLAIEMIAHYGTGMPAGQSVFDTCVWIGRFIEAFGGDWHLIPRTQVKHHLCGNMRAKDPNVRQAVIDRYPATGGGKVPQVGTQKQPGPLYGVSSHVWSALAVGLTFQDTRCSNEE